jgi:hypothetical protein
LSIPATVRSTVGVDDGALPLAKRRLDGGGRRRSQHTQGIVVVATRDLIEENEK